MKFLRVAGETNGYFIDNTHMVNELNRITSISHTKGNI